MKELEVVKFVMEKEELLKVYGVEIKKLGIELKIVVEEEFEVVGLKK